MDDLELEAVLDEMIDDPTEITGVTEGEVEELLTEELDPDYENSEDLTAKTKSAKAKICELPLSKIKGIMKMDPEVVMVGSEAVFAVAKAAELFLQALAKQSYKHTAAQKKKTVQRSHVDAAVTGSDGLFFLEDALE